MSNFDHRSQSALLVVDVQNGVVRNAVNRDAVLANIQELVNRARLKNVPVIWIRHTDENLCAETAAWQIVSELTPLATEPLIEKQYGDSFEETALESLLANLNVFHLIVVGAQTDACIRSTLHGAFVRGYAVTLVSDAHSTEDQSKWGAPPPEQVIAHTNLYWQYQTAPNRKAAVVATNKISF